VNYNVRNLLVKNPNAALAILKTLRLPLFKLTNIAPRPTLAAATFPVSWK